MAHLIVHEPGRVVFSVPFDEALSIGRHESNDVRLGDAKVSRRHLRLERAGEGWQVVDLGSIHGTRVGGERVSARQLADGDRIRAGAVTLTFYEGDSLPGEIVEHDDEGATLVGAAAAMAGPGGQDPRLGLLYELAHAVDATVDTDELLGRVLDQVIAATACQRGMVGLAVGDEALRRIVRVRRPAASLARPDLDGVDGDLVVSRAVLDAVLGRRQAVILHGALNVVPATMALHGVRAAMAVPLRVGERLIGLIYVDDRDRTDRFTQRDLDFLMAVGHLCAAVIDSQRIAALAESLAESVPAGELLGASPPMRRLQAMIRKCAPVGDAHVLVRGETGSGKELVARALHRLSPRADQPFVAVNCAALPDTLVESELFGHVRGAFTGAVRDQKGKLTLAHRGTLLLDEIGDLGATAQAKVLRAIETGEVQPLGAERPLRVDVRIVAASHKRLDAEVAAGRFREDLYYRLKVIEIELAPLRERGDDVILLGEQFLREAALRLRRRLDGFSPAAIEAMRRHRWPGNVRELRHAVERAAVLAESPIIEQGLLGIPSVSSAAARTAGAGDEEQAGPQSLADELKLAKERELAVFREALRRARGNVSEAARLLGVTRIVMRRKMERYGLE